MQGILFSCLSTALHGKAVDDLQGLLDQFLGNSDLILEILAAGGDFPIQHQQPEVDPFERLHDSILQAEAHFFAAFLFCRQDLPRHFLQIVLEMVGFFKKQARFPALDLELAIYGVMTVARLNKDGKSGESESSI
ncbi:MAG: hypothetical protein WCH98_17435, partial [Verrucomicrobiota bacterium]